MSLIKANALQIGQSNIATENFTLAIPASPSGAIKLARGNSGATTQDVLSVDPSGNIDALVKSSGSNTARSLANRFADVVNVKDFGAVGDGVTDDTSAIQSALTFGIGKSVYFPSSNYKITSTLSVPSNTWVYGYGATILCTTSQFNAISMANGGGIAGLTIIGFASGAYNTNGIGIKCIGTNNSPSTPTYVNGPTIQDCKISNFGFYGIYFGYVNGGLINQNKISGIGYAGIAGISCNDVSVNSNTIENIGPGVGAGGDAYGIFIDRLNGTSETADPRSYRCVISNNIVKNVIVTGGIGGQGIDTHAGIEFVIDGNLIIDCQAGIFLTASSISGLEQLAPKRCIVTNNVIKSNLFVNYGILVYGARSGITIYDYAEDCVIANNSITGHGSLTSGTIPAAWISVTKNLSLLGNTFKNNGAAGIILDFQNIGFNISGNSIIDPYSSSYANPSCIVVYSIDNRGYIGGNTFKYENAALGTYVAVNSIMVENAITGLDIDFGKSTFIGIDATHLSFNALTTAGVRYYGLFEASGIGSIVVSNGVSNGITDVVFPKRMPYIPNVNVSLRYPYNGGGKSPVIGVDTTVAVSKTGFRIYATPYDLTTWTSTGSISFSWDAK